MRTNLPSLKHHTARDDLMPVFAEPWEAHAFAIAFKLSEKGLFKWSEWTHALAKEIQKFKDQGLSDSGNTYYQIWLSALEKILLEKKILKKSDLKNMIENWSSSYLSTPHGKPVKIIKFK